MNIKSHYERALSHYLLNTPKKNIGLAIEHFEQAASQGYADAYYFLGRFYGLGDGVSLDFTKAIELYQKGISLGSHKCGYALGMLYYTGTGVQKDESIANDYFKQNYTILLKEAEAGDPVSIHILGTYYYYGFGVQRYIFKAIEWFLKSSELGYSDSQYMLGMIYETIGEDENQKETAIKYYKLAAKQSHPYAQYALGIIAIEDKNWHEAEKNLENAAFQQYSLAAYTLGRYYHEHDPKHPKKAYDWFLQAAKQENVEACYYVGLYYQNGKGVKQDIKEAVFWYEKAALKKDKDALYHLAMILIKQPDKDYQVVAKLLEQAAAQDHRNAQYNLAVMYQKGDGVVKSEQKSLFWYEKAAAQGLPIAQYNLGMIYFQGKFVEKDEEKAKELWQKAADQGLEAAIKLINSIDNYAKLQKSDWQA